MPLDYLSYFTMVLRGIHWNIYICQADDSIPYKLEFSHYSEVIHGSKTFKLTKGSKVEKKMINYSVWCFGSFIFFIPVSQTISVINKSGMCFFSHIKLVVCVPECVCATACIESIRLWHIQRGFGTSQPLWEPKFAS